MIFIKYTLKIGLSSSTAQSVFFSPQVFSLHRSSLFLCSLFALPCPSRSFFRSHSQVAAAKEAAAREAAAVTVTPSPYCRFCNHLGPHLLIFFLRFCLHLLVQ